MSEKMRVERTKEGKPALWESGGGKGKTGGAQIIAGKNGERKTPIVVMADVEKHALFILNRGDIIVELSRQLARQREDLRIRIYRVSAFSEITAKHIIEKPYEVREEVVSIASIKTVNSFDNGEWKTPLAEEHKAAVEAAEAKSRDNQCRKPYYYCIGKDYELKICGRGE